MNTPPLQQIDQQLRAVFANFSDVQMVILFGSVAAGNAHMYSDLDIAVWANAPLSVTEKMNLIAALADKIGRPVDLIDLRTAGEPLLGKILSTGRRILGSGTLFATLVSHHLIEEADFMPYVRRILKERRMAWIGKS